MTKVVNLYVPISIYEFICSFILIIQCLCTIAYTNVNIGPWWVGTWLNILLSTNQSNKIMKNTLSQNFKIIEEFSNKTENLKFRVGGVGQLSLLSVYILVVLFFHTFNFLYKWKNSHFTMWWKAISLCLSNVIVCLVSNPTKKKFLFFLWGRDANKKLLKGIIHKIKLFNFCQYGRQVWMRLYFFGLCSLFIFLYFW